MRLALISDIHGNLEALEAVLLALDALKPDAIYCAGDVVGYGGDPVPCVDVVRKTAAGCLLGNHDAAAVGLTDANLFHPVARESDEWTARQLDAASVAFLKGLPITLTLAGALVVHSTPYQPEAWHYLTDEVIALQSFSVFSDRIGFVGHSHVPGVFVLRDDRLVAQLPSGDLKVEQEARYLVNVGSVGQPRDGDPRACFVFLETDGPQISFHRVEYDVERAQQKIVAAGLPTMLAARLALGR